MYGLFETAEFSKSIGKLSSKDAQFLKNKLSEYAYPQLRVEPHFGQNIKKLKNYTPDTWRCRIGNFRVFYTLDEEDNIVLLLVVTNRGKAYK